MLVNRITLVRKTLGLTQREFGEKMGVSRDVIGNIEYRRVPPKKLFFNKLELLDIDMWYKDFISSGKYDLTDFVEECINKWLIQEQKRQLEMLGLNMSAY